MLQTRKQQQGTHAEREACLFLEKKGFSVLEKNFRCRLGEIDLIMADGDDVVFVEVRSRSRTDYGRASETVNRVKQHKIIQTATYYLQKKRWLSTRNGRFDVIEVHYADGHPTLDWFKSAFLAGH